MAKKIVIVFIVVLLLALLCCGGFILFKRNNDLAGLPDYYKNLVKKCNPDFYNCCLQSVKTMAEGNYQLEPKAGCPPDMEGIIAQCPGSYSMCVPKGRFFISSDCQKAGGQTDELTECNGSISKVCTLANGDTCYEENIKDGQCSGVFSPKVLCDQ